MNATSLKWHANPHCEVNALEILLCFGVFKRMLGVSSLIMLGNIESSRKTNKMSKRFQPKFES